MGGGGGAEVRSRDPLAGAKAIARAVLPRLARQGWLSQELGHGRDTVTAKMPLEAWEVG